MDQLTIYPKYGHSELAREFYKDTLYNWIFQFHLNDPNIENKSTVDTPQKTLNLDSAIYNTKPISAYEKNIKMESVNCFYTIKKGDTLYSIAKNNSTSVTKLCKLNILKEKSILHIGQKIKINC